MESRSSFGIGRWVLIIFLIVLAMHVVGILGIAMVNGWKFNAPAEPVGQPANAPPAEALSVQKDILAEKSASPVARNAAPLSLEEDIQTPEQASLLKEIVSNYDESEEGLILPVPVSDETVAPLKNGKASAEPVPETASRISAGTLKSAEKTGGSVAKDGNASEPSKLAGAAPIPKEKAVAVQGKSVPSGVNTTKTVLAQPAKVYASYNVQKGDTLSKIARIYNTTAESLCRINSLKDPNSLKQGMTIKVPQK